MSDGLAAMHPEFVASEQVPSADWLLALPTKPVIWSPLERSREKVTRTEVFFCQMGFSVSHVGLL